VTVLWWLLGHAWWGLPALGALIAGGAFAFGAWPVLLGIVGKIPPRLLLPLVAVLAAVIAGSGLYAVGLKHGEERTLAAQEAAEKRADAKAGRVAKQAHDDAEKATAVIRDRTEDVADEVEREMDGARVCPEPVQPERVRELGEQAVEAARRALQAG
jgi:hypothetical protein